MNTHQTMVLAVLERHTGEKGSLLPILHDIQAQLGFIPNEAVPSIAKALRMSNAQVHGVISYYHDFKTQAPTAKHQVKLCVAEACQARGANALMAHCQSLVATQGVNELALEAVYCLGQCATGPALLLDGELKSRMDAAQLSACLYDGGA